MKKMLALIIGALFATALAGCNTVQGMGKDIRNAGTAIEQAANK